MKTRLWTLVCVALILGGCRQPADIELVSDDELNNIEVFPVSLPDTNITVASVDSSGILPQDQVRFAGFFTITSITWDAGIAKESIAYSRVFFTDSTVRALGRTVGFLGRDIGTVMLNGNLMFKIPHRIPASRIFNRDTVITSGVEYLADLSSSYQSDHVYIWSITKNLQPVYTTLIESPEQLTVLTPRGGGIYSRSHNLPVTWAGGKGKLSVVLSRYDPVARQARPLLEFRIRANNGKAVLPAKLLSQLPKHTRYVLTFILANKREGQVTQPLPGKVFVQAASVYNTFVELR